MSRITVFRFTAEFTARHYRALAHRLAANESGQDIVEYAGLLAIIALVVGVIFALHLENTIGTALSNTVSSIISGHGSSASSGTPTSGKHG